MKKLIISFLFLIITTGISGADTILFNSPETIDSPTATQMEWEVIKINATEQVLQIKYRWLDSNDAPIRSTAGSMWSTWTCKNVPDNNPISNTDCVAAGDPDGCCTGLDTGICDDVDTCFTDVFQFSIRAQDVGTSIGLGLRSLIWNQMKADVLTGGNDGSFE